MKTRIVLLVLACMFTARLGAQDSTAKPRTLFGILPFRGAHLDWGGGTVPYLDKMKSGGSAAEMRISLPFRKYPDWSVVFSSTAVMETDTTSYVVPASVTPTSTGYHPHLGSSSIAVGLERRWTQTRILHGIASFGMGTIENSYNYYHTVDDVSTRYEDEKTTTSFAQVAGGGELNVARWLRLTAMVGYRTGGRMKVPQAKGSNGGMTTSFSFLLGKF